MSVNEDRCTALGIPTHLHTGGREVTEVKNEEDLYRRFRIEGNKEEWLKDDSKASSSLFKLENDSYNRSSLCESPEDVLYDDEGNHFPDNGILSLSVEDLRHEDSKFTIEVNDSGERVFTFVVEHDPKECNYAHAEVIVYENGAPAPKNPTSLKKAFRKILTTHLTVIKNFKA
ncbi:hypothetical protein [Spirosoma sp. KUDC1026]|uniref:hypothetical protein n=1 Tax=Spirosoma sp. KUDC1026 TaxID=2745947 RepID=UPI00159BA6C8|nr:hypothetical protein [Spirosoma sp. KUDC1026]QKZ13984.1 hypothetical protein HU175_15645 [Spirosoma sp. KUDC1026]